MKAGSILIELSWIGATPHHAPFNGVNLVVRAKSSLSSPRGAVLRRRFLPMLWKFDLFAAPRRGFGFKQTAADVSETAAPAAEQAEGDEEAAIAYV